MKTFLLFTFLLINSLGFSQVPRTTSISCDLYNTCSDFNSYAFISTSEGDEALVLMPEDQKREAYKDGVTSYLFTNGYYYEIYLSSCGVTHLIVLDLLGVPVTDQEVIEQLSIDFETADSIYTIQRRKNE
jgi:hypothetical protein